MVAWFCYNYSFLIQIEGNVEYRDIGWIEQVDWDVMLEQELDL